VSAGADIAELRTQVEELNRSIDNIEPTLESSSEQLMTFRQLERVALRYLTIAKRMGLPDDVNRAIEFLFRLIVIIRMVQISMNMLMLGTPYGWLMGAAGLVMTGLSMGSVLEGY
jgi:hypothetical protein